MDIFRDGSIMKYMKKTLLLMFTVYYAVLFLIIIILPILLIPFIYIFDKILCGRKFISLTMKFMSKLVVWGTFSIVKVVGRSELPHSGGNIVFVVNHQSYFDIPLILGWVDSRTRFVARENLFSVPILGIWMKMMRCIPISRKASREELRRFDDISKVLIDGAIITVFPEGTRSVDGSFGKIHTSAFRPARIAKSVIVPIFLWGSHKILPRRKRTIRPTKVKIVIGEPIEFEKYSSSAPKELAEQILARFNKMKNDNILT